MSAFTPLTGAPCTCRRGVQRDNCPACEGTGKRIDFAAIHRAGPLCENCHEPPARVGNLDGDKRCAKCAARAAELAAVLEADAGPTVAQVERATAGYKPASEGRKP